MYVKIMVKNNFQQKKVNIFYQDFACLQYHHLKTYEISMIITDVKVALKSFVNL